MPLSPAAAAKRAGVSRSLISREIKNGTLPATLKNNGHHSIAQEDLQVWIDRRTERAPAPEPSTQAPVTHPNEIDRIETLTHELATTREALARLEGQADATAARLADLVSDRDAWRAQAEKLSEGQRASSLWGRIFGR